MFVKFEDFMIIFYIRALCDISSTSFNKILQNLSVWYLYLGVIEWLLFNTNSAICSASYIMAKTS
jgi:hypothetical protein